MTISVSNNKPKAMRIACAVAVSAVLGITLAGTANVSQAHGATATVKSSVKVVKSSKFSKAVSMGKTAGSTKSNAKAVTAIKIAKKGGVSGNVSYTVGFSNASGTKTAKNGKAAEKNGKSISKIKVSLSGKLKSAYNVYYRVYVKDYGWMGWAKNGKFAGNDCKKAITAYQVKLVKKGSKSVPNTDRAAFSKKGGFLVSISGDSKADAKIKSIATKNKMDLAKCFDWAKYTGVASDNIRYAGSNGIIRSNKSWTTSRIKTEARSAFVDGHGDCYTYSVAIYCFAKYLGYDAKPVAGTSVNASTNEPMDTSWTEVKQNGKWMIYDGMHPSVGNGAYYAGQFKETWKSYAN